MPYFWKITRLYVEISDLSNIIVSGDRARRERNQHRDLRVSTFPSKSTDAVGLTKINRYKRKLEKPCFNFHVNVLFIENSLINELLV